MSKKNKVSERFTEVVETPIPPQIMDPSSPPGMGKNSDYNKGNKKSRDEKK